MSAPPVKDYTNGYALIGPHGNVWAHELFLTPADAMKYLANYWGMTSFDPAKWSVVPAHRPITIDVQNVKPTPLSEIAK